MTNTRKELERAFRLIKREKNEEALEILGPVLEQEPDNPHAWWLLAYAETEPTRVREALIMVLQLDPNYSNAPKARDMLAQVNAQYPPTEEEIMRFPEVLGGSAFPDVFDADDIFGEREESDTEFSTELDSDPFADVFGSSEAFETERSAFTDTFESDFDSSLESSDLFDELDSEPFEGEAYEVAEHETEAVELDESDVAPRKSRRQPEDSQDAIRQAALEMGLDPDALDDDTLATLEEQTARRQRGRRGRRVVFTFLVLALVLVVVLVVLAFISGGEGAQEPEALAAQDATSDSVRIAIADAEADLASTDLGAEERAVLADSSLGSTLYIEFCSEPGPDLPQRIARGMEIAANQAAAVQGEVDAVGVSVDVCRGTERDTLYRAFVPVDGAASFAASTIRDELSWATFQATWRTP